MPPPRENSIFDDKSLGLRQHYINFESKFYMLVKRIFGITCAQNGKNTLTVVKVIQGKL